MVRSVLWYADNDALNRIIIGKLGERRKTMMRPRPMNLRRRRNLKRKNPRRNLRLRLAKPSRPNSLVRNARR